MMLKKILIANRGEIACRVLRTAQHMGIHCVAVYSDPDAQALHVQLADEAYRIGAAASRDSYLQGDVIIQVAQQCGAQAIHPGYGFLSENPEFAETCSDAGIIFIGPPAAAIRAMGLKSTAKRIMEQAGIPLVPGYHGEQQSLTVLQQAAEQIGYPVVLKPAAGGGGKGMRVVWTATEFKAALASAQREALASFNNDQMIVEKYLINPRHIEIQIFADAYGQIVHLFERDCSIQRRHQKIIEEAPAVGLADELRQQMGEVAIAAARAIGYVGAGTVEFLLDAEGNFYFMEMNTRLQVEHPITEMITGQDLVAWQLQIAAGAPLPYTQEQLTCTGHAIEARIYAEDPAQDFLPAIGELLYLNFPSTNQYVRIDSGVQQGDTISMYYDPMLAKLIVWDKDRETALQRLQTALAQTKIIGVTTNVKFLHHIATMPAFMVGEININFIQTHQQDLQQQSVINSEYAPVLAAVYQLLKHKHAAENIACESRDRFSPWLVVDGWQMNITQPQMLFFTINQQQIAIKVFVQANDSLVLQTPNTNFSIKATLKDDHHLQAYINDVFIQAIIIPEQTLLHIMIGNSYQVVEAVNPFALVIEDAAETNHLVSPMPGIVVALLAQPGEQVERGKGLMIIEAMKMEHTIQAPANGIIKEFYFKAGDAVKEGMDLLDFEIQ